MKGSDQMYFRKGEIVYCVDENSQYYGRKLIVDELSEDGEPFFSDYITDESVPVNSSQVSTIDPR
jgi:hypothetical protein